MLNIILFIELNNALFTRQKLDGQFQETQMVFSVIYTLCF